MTVAVSSLSRLLATARTALVGGALATFFAMFLTSNGFLANLDARWRDAAIFSHRHAASGNVVLVVADSETVRATGRYPYDRGLIARVLDTLASAGADRIHLDATLNAIEDPISDAALAAAIDRLGPDRISLPAQRGSLSVGDPRPLTSFARAATLVSSEFPLDADRWVRRLQSVEAGHPLPGDWLARRARPFGEDQIVDLAIDATSLPKYEMRDVAEGRVPAEAFAGRKILIGMDVRSPAHVVWAPVVGEIQRLAFLALGAETSLEGVELAPQPKGAILVGVLILSVLLAAATVAVGPRFGLLLLVIGVGVWARWFGDLVWFGGHLLSPLLPVLALLTAWQIGALGQSRSVDFVRRRVARIWGVGRNALVAAADVVGDPAFVIDRDGTVVGANDAFRRVAAGCGLGSVRSIVHLADDASVSAAILKRTADRGRRSDLPLFTVADDEKFIFELHAAWTDTLSGPHAIVVMKDVTEERAREAELRALTYRDHMTGIANRKAFDERVACVAAQTEICTILLIDLDGFKAVNDRLGHHAGDELLRGVADRLTDLSGPGAYVARLGGDEFAILLSERTEEDGCLLAEAIMSALSRPFEIDGHMARVGACVGIAVWKADGTDPREVVKKADAAMYAAKRVKPAYAVHRRSDIDVRRARPPLGDGSTRSRNEAA